MNMINSILSKFRGDADTYVTISPVARAVKQDLENWPDKTQLQPEIRAAIYDKHLSGLSNEQAAADLYSGLLLFEPTEFLGFGGVVGLYLGVFEDCNHKVDNCERDWDLSTATYLNTLRVAQALAPNVLIGMRGGSWLLTSLIQRAAETKNPELTDAIAELINAALSSKVENVAIMRQDLNQWIQITGLTPEDIPAQRALDQKSAKLFEERNRIVDAAPLPLGTLLESAFESKIGYYKLAKGHHPHVDAVIDTSPAERGIAVQFLLDLVVDSEGCRNFTYLGRKNGRWSHELAQHDQPTVLLDALTVFLSRFAHTLDERDATHAKLVFLLNHRGWHAYFAPNAMLLRELLKTVTQAPKGKTAKGMRALVDLPAFNKWRHPLQKVLDENANGDHVSDAMSLSVPKWGLGKYDEAEKFSSHFADIFDARLYCSPHNDYLLKIIEISQTLKAAQESGKSPKDLEVLLIAELGKADVGSDIDEQNLLSWPSSIWPAAVYFLNLAREAYGRREAVRPLIDQHPDVLRDISGLAMSLTNGATPTPKWLAEAYRIFGIIAPSMWVQLLETLSLCEAPRRNPTGLSSEPYVRTLIYITSYLPANDIGPALVRYALKQCYVTEPGVGIRNEKLGNACVWALANMPDGSGVPYLARILSRTKYPKIRKRVDIQLNEAAAKAGIARADLDEATVPTHDLDNDGERAVEFENGIATLLVEGSDARIAWTNAAGKSVRAPTKAMREEKERMKEVRAELKELQADLSIQPQRLQKLYLQDRTWPTSDWRERYLEHPLMRCFSRRLIWLVESSSKKAVSAFPDADGDTLLSITGEVVDLEGATIRLWHPMDVSVDAIEAWRDRLEELQVTQPFAQAWREVYALTDAERQTATYSNRWAAHILKQQQAMTLARINGWTVTARMWVDQPNDEPWHIYLPEHNLVAEYWIGGAGGDDPEVNESCAYLFVNTDRVSFFRAPEGAIDSARGPSTGDPLPLEDIPPVIFSEVMRNCDLFTAVASISADAAWLDRGRGATHPNQWGDLANQYWHETNTAELVESGKRRRAMLERIIPRLAIANRLTLKENTLAVQGSRHLYNIHLGSGACSRSSRHICIVPKSSAAKDKVWLPFEGDRTLSIIISKATLLAADDKITDPIILAQL